jgi:uncharacterized repeat protein (TIGR01451 family)
VSPIKRSLLMIVIIFAVGASAASARNRQALHAHTTAACKPSETRAAIGGKPTCLRVGKACQKKLDRQYHRYRFHCHTGRLTRTVNPKLKPPALKSADLSISVTDTPDPVTVGADIAYTIAVTNAGPSTAERIIVSGFPIGMITPDPGWACTSGGSIQCALAQLPSGTASTIRVAVRALAASTLSNTFSVTSALTDPNTANNTAAVQTTVVAIADLAVTATDTPDPAAAGSNLTYTVTVTNAGPSAAENVRVVVSPPAGAVSFVSATASQGSCTTLTAAECALGAMAAGASVTATVVVRASAAGSLVASVSAASLTQDPDTANNAVSVTTTVTSPPRGNCAASYPDVCIPPPPPDLDCAQIPYRNFRVIYTVPDPDPHRFDGDRDGIGCES